MMDTMDDQGTERQVMASRLREARNTIGLTQSDAATVLGISRPAVAAMELGQRNVSGIELRRLSRLYRRDMAWLVGEIDDAPIDAELDRAIATLSEQDRRLVAQYARFLASQTATGNARSRS